MKDGRTDGRQEVEVLMALVVRPVGRGLMALIRPPLMLLSSQEPIIMGALRFLRGSQ